MGKTIISWATYTVNVVSGCSKPPAVTETGLRLIAEAGLPDVEAKWLQSGTSPECQRCYAETLSLRRGWSPGGAWTEEHEDLNVRLRPERFKEFAKVPVKSIRLPPSRRERFFVCSMGDLFHRLVPDPFLHHLFAVANAVPHIYQFLTKRPERAMTWPGPWAEHMWLGTSVGHPATKWRIEALRRSQAKVRFVSMEPMVASMLPINLAGIDQVIVGGESGSGYRKLAMPWVREIRDECARTGTAFFMKQDAHYATEKRCYLVEEDGTCKQYRQFPGELTPPTIVQPDSEKYHSETFRIIQ
jgi:protein gp37